jgi:hypothetical protein
MHAGHPGSLQSRTSHPAGTGAQYDSISPGIPPSTLVAVWTQMYPVRHVVIPQDTMPSSDVGSDASSHAAIASNHRKRDSDVAARAVFVLIPVRLSTQRADALDVH